MCEANVAQATTERDNSSPRALAPQRGKRVNGHPLSLSGATQPVDHPLQLAGDDGCLVAELLILDGLH